MVPAGHWQAAEPHSETVLAGCTVASGFEFEDFMLTDAGSAEAKRLASLDAGWNRFIA